MKSGFCLLLLSLTLASQALAEGPLSSILPSLPKVPVVFGGLADAFIAYDLNRPSQFDRVFSTVPARHNEFNINMAYLEARLEGERVRGRIAFQAGTEVQALYQNEPTTGAISGPALSRFIQEAYAGYRFGDDFWLDAGILESYLGFESATTKDNWTYSHSLLSDLTPYYEAGVRASFGVVDGVTAQIHMVNGWQNISENNAAKGFGLRLEYTPLESLVLTYNSFAGKEVGDRRRFFQDGRVKIRISECLEGAAIYALGMQTQANSTNQDWWEGGTLLVRGTWTQRLSTTLRGEVVSDPNRVVTRVTTPDGFLVGGVSAGADYRLAQNLLARLEFRQLWSLDALFPSNTSNRRRDTSGVVSWSIWF